MKKEKSEKPTTLQERLSAAREKLSKLLKRRGEVALVAVSDPEKASSYDALIEEQMRLEREVQVIDAAIAQVRANEETAAAAAAREARDAARKAEIERFQQLRSQALTLSRQADELLGQLVACLQARYATLLELSRIQGVASNRILSIGLVTRALRFFGLHNYVDIGHVPIHHREALFDQTERWIPKELPEKSEAQAPSAA